MPSNHDFLRLPLQGEWGLPRRRARRVFARVKKADKAKCWLGTSLLAKAKRRDWWRLTVEQACKGPRRPIMNVLRRGFKADDQWVPEGAVSWHWCGGAKGLFPMPRRYKARNNATARLIVDADRFYADVECARRIGLFDRPDSCGSGVWSREELCPF